MKKIAFICMLLVAVHLAAVVADPWGPKVMYNSGMSLTCRITVNGVNATENDLLMVAVGNEVRGKTNLERITNNSVEPNSVGRNFLIQSAHDGEVFNFYLWRPNPPDGQLARIWTTTYTLISIVGGQHGGLGNYQTIDFTYQTYSVQGRATLGVGGPGIPNVRMIVQNSNPTYNSSFYSSLITDNIGEYCLPGILGGTNITFEPYHPAYAFTPVNYSSGGGLYQVVTQNFIATALATFMVSGTVMTSDSQPVPDVFIYHDNFTDTDVTTNVSGVYSFPLVQGNSIAIAPSKPGWTFLDTVTSQPLVNIITISAPQTINFIGSATYLSISGNTGTPEATVTYTCDSSTDGTTTSDTSSNFTINNIVYGDRVVVTPSKAGFTFSPPNRTLNNIITHQSGINFNASVTNHSISGSVTLSGSPMPGIELYIGGTLIATTNATGSYSFARPYGDSFIYYPLANGYSFDPPNKQINFLDANVSQNFVATVIPTWEVTVAVMEGSPAVPVSGVTIAYSVANGPSGNGATNASGEVTFTLNETNSTITFTPSHPAYNFTPTSFPLAGLGDDTTVTFTATRKTFTITGNTGTGGVTISVSDGRPDIISNPDGSFTLPDVPYGATITLTPSKDGYTFSPTSYPVNNVTSNLNLGTIFTANIIRYPITVTCVDHLNVPIPSVTVTHEGGTGATNASGVYTFNADWGSSGTVSVRKNGVVFDISSEQYTTLLGPLSFSFVSRPAIEYTLSGNVIMADSGDPLEGVRIQAGDHFGFTDADGDYSFSVWEAEYFNITPSKTGYQFTPSVDPINYVSGSFTSDFTAEIAIYNINGIVLKNGQPLAGVDIVLNGGTPFTTLTDGLFAFTATHGSSINIVPTCTGYSFTPADFTTSALLAPVSNIVFEASAQPLVISGYVGFDYTPGYAIADVIVYDENSTRTATTDEFGLYQMTVLYGDHVILRPEKALHSFNPETREYINITAGVQNQDFTATAICDVVTFSLPGGSYPNPISVELATTTTAATIYFTIDGSTPTASSEVYNGQAINIPRDSNITIRAFASKDAFISSAVTQATYIVTGFAYKPSIYLASGSFTHAINVTITKPTYIPNLDLPPGDANDYYIYYTTNGDTPSSASQQYIAPIFINKNTVLKAAIMRQNSVVEPDSVATAYYEINHIMTLHFLDTIYLRENDYNITIDVTNYLADSVLGEHIYSVSVIDEPQFINYVVVDPASILIMQPPNWSGSDDLRVKIQYNPIPLPPNPLSIGNNPPNPSLYNWAEDTVHIYVHPVSEFDTTSSVITEKKLTSYPNPFNPQTTILFALPTDNDIDLAVYNIKGQLIKQLAGGRYPKGSHRVVWDASGQSSGIYFVALRYAGYSKMHKMILMK